MIAILTTSGMIKRVSRKYLVICLVTCLTILFPELLSAQIDFRPGYVVKNGSDTVKGFVAYRTDKKNIEQCTFKESRKAKANDYTAADIAGFGIYGDRSYQSMIMPADAPAQGKVFAKIIVQGYLNLYEHKNFFLLKKKDSLFTLPVPKNEVYGPPGEQKTRKSNKFIGVLTYVMLDCPMNTKALSYSEGPLSEIVYNYNTCVKRGSNQRNQRPMAKVGLALFTGYVVSNLTYDFNKVIPFKGNTVIGGAGIDLSSPRVYDKFFFSIEAWYSKNFYQGYYEGTYNGDPIKQDLFADFTNLKIPFGIKYNFKSPGNTPYFKTGVFWSSTISSSVRTVEERKLPDAIYTDEYTTGYQFKNPKGFWFSLGYDKTVFKSTRLFAEFRYERGEGYMGSPVVNDSHMVNYNFLAGLRF